MTTNADDSLRRRRERGRRSQAGFRKRQAESYQQMREENERLKSAIEKLVSSMRGDEDPELLETICDVAEAAGIEAAHRPTTQSDMVQLRPRHVDPRSQGKVLMTAPRGDEDITITAATGEYTVRAADELPAATTITDNADSPLSSPSSSPPTTTTSTSTSPPLLTCGIWFDHLHYMRITIPPDDILPYLGAGAQTFAGVLFWSLMDLAQKGFVSDDAAAARTNAVVVRRGLGHAEATAGWEVRHVRAMVESRQEYKRTGSISPRYAAVAEPDLGIAVRDAISAEYRGRGLDPDRFVSTLGVEKRVRGMVGGRTFAVLEAAARGGVDPALCRLFERDVKGRLYETAICFGDGPRWSVDIVDGIFLSWFHQSLGFTFP
ncbi:Uu.00g122990.m01.CDS01 [Anthostomella pinea]|uniref:Uu.00g122990.m01.CDS01 n=1 Tax=Anthostomella pinea TaxID=933095 RepID=A0AAI8YHC9_9PEZI|nr:Uu.00g122990.m01.CDS01 [Anthostomella pinea]